MDTTVTAPMTLKVAEGRLPDAGRALARFDPADMTRLSTSAGTIVEITGKKTAAVKVMPAFRDVRGKRLVQIDDLTWDDVGGLDEVKQTLREIVEWPIRHRDLARSRAPAPWTIRSHH